MIDVFEEKNNKIEAPQIRSSFLGHHRHLSEETPEAELGFFNAEFWSLAGCVAHAGSS